MSQALLLRFGQEELIYLLRALKLERAAGLTQDSFGSLDDDHKALALAVADRTLRAREVISWANATERDVDPIAADFLRTCAQPRYELHIEIKDQPTMTVAVRYAFANQAAIEQSEPEPGIYQFISSSDRQDLLKRIFKICQFEGAEEAYGPPQTISRAVFDAASAAAATSRDYAFQALSRELRADSASALADTMAKSTSIRSFRFTPNNSESRDARLVMVMLLGPNHLWIVEGPDEQDAIWNVNPGSNALLRDRLEAFLQPALRSMAVSS